LPKSTWVGEVDALVEELVDAVVSGHLGPLVPGERAPFLDCRRCEHGLQCIPELKGTVAAGRVYKAHEA
jgi:hypothetical protein